MMILNETNLPRILEHLGCQFVRYKHCTNVGELICLVFCVPNGYPDNDNARLGIDYLVRPIDYSVEEMTKEFVPLLLNYLEKKLNISGTSLINEDYEIDDDVQSLKNLTSNEISNCIDELSIMKSLNMMVLSSPNHNVRNNMKLPSIQDIYREEIQQKLTDTTNNDSAIRYANERRENCWTGYNCVKDFFELAMNIKAMHMNTIYIAKLNFVVGETVHFPYQECLRKAIIVNSFSNGKFYNIKLVDGPGELQPEHCNIPYENLERQLDTQNYLFGLCDIIKHSLDAELSETYSEILNNEQYVRDFLTVKPCRNGNMIFYIIMIVIRRLNIRNLIDFDLSKTPRSTRFQLYKKTHCDMLRSLSEAPGRVSCNNLPLFQVTSINSNNTDKVDIVINKLLHEEGIHITSNEIQSNLQFVMAYLKIRNERVLARLGENVHWMLHPDKWGVRPVAAYLYFCGGGRNLGTLSIGELVRAAKAGEYFVNSNQS
jgi:hypothetical protein